MVDRPVIFARRLPSREAVEVARDRLYEYMVARSADPHRADPPPMSVGAGVDADSADGFIVVITTEPHTVEVELLVNEYVSGKELPLEEVPPDYLEGLLVRRAQMSREGQITRFDTPTGRPMKLNADGSLKEF